MLKNYLLRGSQRDRGGSTGRIPVGIEINLSGFVWYMSIGRSKTLKFSS